jgi:hypothetical protein
MPSIGTPLRLPLELLYKIIEDVAMSPHDILNLRCVNKVFYGLATPLAFREIEVRTTEESAQGFLNLLVSTDIPKYVRVIQIIEDPSERGLVTASRSADGILLSSMIRTISQIYSISREYSGVKLMKLTISEVLLCST